MGAKFINTRYENTIDQLVKGNLAKFNNPYYTFTDKTPFKVDYFSVNQAKSTLDEGSKLIYARLGDDSPLRYNIIENAYLFGLEKVETQYENGEWGLQVSEIEGEGYVLPDTFEPVPNDYFRIKHIKENLLFKVTDVTKDTLENGGNFYKISYRLDQIDASVIENQVVDRYKMIVGNAGTQFKAVIRDTTYDLIKELEITTSTLKKYFNTLFFRDRVQTFTFTFNGKNFYDPYMIEFLMRNKTLSNADDYVFIDHACVTPRSFAIEYDRSFLRGFEERDIDKFVADSQFIAEQVKDINSLMSTQYEPYYSISHNAPMGAKLERFTLLNPDFIGNLAIGDRFKPGEKGEFYNILIDYFDKKEITGRDIELIKGIDYEDYKELFYAIPMIIYAIEDNITNMLL